MEIKQQSNKKATRNSRSKSKNKTKQKTKKRKLMNILGHNKNLLTVMEWLQQTQSKRGGRMLCQQNTPQIIAWLTYDRSSKHATNLKCLL